MELDRTVNGIGALKRDEAKISLVGVPDEPGIASRLFRELGNQS